ncbi:MAG: DUF4350 domain-containing protein [Dongiaceae bacterium]
MNNAPIFAQRTIVWLLGVGGVSFVLAIALVAFGEDLLPTSTVEANAYSESAIGHKAFVETLQRVGIPVLVSRGDSMLKAGPSDILVVAEPPMEMKDDGYLLELLSADRVLFVLPKWRATRDPKNPSWAGQVARLSSSDVNEVLRIVTSGYATRAEPHRIDWKSGRFGRGATLTEPQLIVSNGLMPIIDSSLGQLLGEVEDSDGRTWVLSDPDLISNRGLQKGDNAIIAVGIIQALMPEDGTVIVDEVIHGFRRDPSVWRALFEFPIILITINALAAAAMLIWAATARFGSPVPVEPPLKAGKATLIGNAAGLLRFGGHAAEILGRYFAVTFGDVARRVHAPAQLADSALDQWLDRIGRARKARAAAASLRRDAEQAQVPGRLDDRRVLHVARALYSWKQEMLHGSGDDTLGQRPSEAAGAQGRRRSGRGH